VFGLLNQPLKPFNHRNFLFVATAQSKSKLNVQLLIISHRHMETVHGRMLWLQLTCVEKLTTNETNLSAFASMTGFLVTSGHELFTQKRSKEPMTSKCDIIRQQ